MGQVIVVTGANGFVGRACVARARALDLDVIALYRSTALDGWQGDAGITPVQMDLTAPDAVDRLADLLPDNAAIIHAAAHLGGDPAILARDTVSAMTTLMQARDAAQHRLVLISSLAVYDMDSLTAMDSLTEATPLIAMPDTALDDPDAYIQTARDAYAGAKRVQEAMLTHDDGAEDDWVLRPGAIWGPGRSWHALQGFWASKLFVTIGSEGQLPLVHVDHVAQSAVEAARSPTEGVPVLNVFDDDLPTRARFLRAHKRCYGWPRLNVTVPYGIWMALLGLLTPVAHRLPGLFRAPVARARLMPLRFPNTRLRSALGGEDRDIFEAMMARTREAEQ